MSYCEMCNKPVPDYEPKMCCSAFDCGCMGMPLEPCMCSKECGEALFDVNGTFEERRTRHGIKIYEECSLCKDTYEVETDRGKKFPCPKCTSEAADG